jgi:glycerate dehydrogenase
MKIVILDGYTQNPGDLSWERFEAIGEVTVYDRTMQHEIIPRIGDAQIVFTNKTPLDDEIFRACPSIKYIGVMATGYNVVDTEAAKKRNITVTNVPAYSTPAVAQLTFGLLLEICHHVGKHNDAIKSGKWSKSPDFCFWDYPLIELAGKTFGCFGYGMIGRNAASIAQAFGMKVIAYTRHPDKALENENMRFVDFDTLLAEADVISLHCPLTPSTKGIINKDAISRMKNGVIIINTSRGPLIVEEDLKQGLIDGKIYYAAMDVVSSEPISEDNPLLTAPNCIITPHIGWAPRESRKRLLEIAAQNLEAYLAGSPVNVVNR